MTIPFTTMKIIIKSYLNGFPETGERQAIEKEIPSSKMTVSDLLASIGAENEQALYFINQKRVKGDHPLTDGDILELVPLLEGG